MKPIFYDCKTAPSPRRARIFLAEKRIDIETREISLAEREQFAPAFLDINPHATVPVLVLDDGTALTENLAIATYVEAVMPEPPLMGVTAKERALVSMWNTISERDGLFAFSDAVRNSHERFSGRATTGTNAYQQIPELADRGAHRLARYFELIERQLEGREFVATDRLSIADITAFVTVEASVSTGRGPNADHTNVWAWQKRISERPSAAI